MENLSILYTFDENYAPWAGISMCSLFANNEDLEELTVYCVADHVKDSTCRLLQEQAERFGRRLIFVESAPIVERIKGLNIPTYRGTHAANFRLFFSMFVEEEAKRLLYLDCDTLITGSLRPLAELDMGDKAVGVVRDSLTVQYKQLIGLAPDDLYFNSGVLLFNIPEWKKQGITERIMDHVRNVQAQYHNPDQDLLNVVLQGRTHLLPPAYNLQPHHLAFRDETFFKVYKPTAYYTAEELEAARQQPVILHVYRYLGDFPWHKDNLHPANELFDRYTAASPWRGLKKKSSGGGLIFKLEKMMYVVLPRRIFLAIFHWITLRNLRKQNETLKQSNK